MSRNTKIRTVFITTFFNGFHCWPEAPAQVGFLRSLHRHKFGVRVEVLVTHDDRQVEFFILQEAVNKIIVKELTKFLTLNSSLSCEMMAEFIWNRLMPNYSIYSITVDEDGENGATLRTDLMSKI